MFARRLPLLLGILIAVPATGEPSPPPPAPDFSAGFTRLAALGLPALDATASWSTLPESSGGGDDYYLRDFLKNLKGNGWSLPPAAGKALGLAAGAVATHELGTRPNNNAPRGLLGNLFGGGGSAKPAAIPAADLAKDVRTLLAAIRKQDDHRDRFTPGSSGDLPGKLLLLATQIYQNGNAPLANELAMAVFEAAGSREAALDSAVSLIADQAYDETAQAFFASNDWAAYHRALTGLVAKFPRGWAAREAVAMLLPQVAKQTAGEPPATPALPAIPLDPKALAAIQQLTAKPSASQSAAEDEQLAKLAGVDLAAIPPHMRARVIASLRQNRRGDLYQSSSPWLLEPPPAKTANPSPLAKLTTLGVAALPALAALTDDPYLTYHANDKAEGGSSYHPSNESDAERTLRIHTRLNRPATRGELACSLLRATLPDTANELYEAGPETLRELALTFWKENQHASRDELAMVFLRDGSSNQIQQAATLLAASAEPTARQAFEAHLLAADPAIAHFQLVQSYLTTRKAAAKTFFEAYAKLVRSQTAGSTEEDRSNSMSYAVKQAGGPEKILKQLEKIVAGISPRALAKEIAHGKPTEAEAAIRALLDMIKDDTPVKRLDVLLEGALAAEDPLIRCHFLSATQSILWQEHDPDNDPPASHTDRPLPEAELKVWQQLVADSREIPKEFVSYLAGQSARVGDFAAAMLACSISQDGTLAVATAAPILRKPPQELFREQAEARLAGKPIPPLPDATRVAADRLRTIITEAGTKAAAEIHPYLNSLTPDERAAWLAWTQDPGEIPPPQSVKDLRFLVISRDQRNDGYGTFPDVKGAGNVDIGFAFTPANLTTLVESLAKDSNKHSRTSLAIYPDTFGPGLQVRAQLVPLPRKTPDNAAADPDATPPRRQPDARSVFGEAITAFGHQQPADAVILVRIPNEKGNLQKAAWLVENGQAKPADPEQPAALEAALQAQAAAPGFPRLIIIIQILSKTDADQLKEPSSNEADPFSDD